MTDENRTAGCAGCSVPQDPAGRELKSAPEGIVPDTLGVAPEGVTISRRRLFQGIGAAIGLMAAGTVPLALTTSPAVGEDAESAAGEENPLAEVLEKDKPVNYPGHPVFYADKAAGKEKWGMVIDVKACVGCRKCVSACVRENNIGRTSGFTYIQVLEMDEGAIDLESADANYTEGGRPGKWYLPVQCMHCEKPSCVYGCPVKATWREPDGIVVIDYDKCIACRNCMITCPYFARHFNWVEPEVPKAEVNPKVPLEEKAGVVEKCTFCIQRTRHGQTTACTDACPVGARKFGDLNDPNSDVSILLKTRRAFRLKEELGNEPVIWYVG